MGLSFTSEHKYWSFMPIFMKPSISMFIKITLYRLLANESIIATDLGQAL